MTEFNVNWEPASVFLPAAHREVRDGVEVGAQHLGVFEQLVSESVESVQRDEQVGGGHPFLKERQVRGMMLEDAVQGHPPLEERRTGTENSRW